MISLYSGALIKMAQTDAKLEKLSDPKLTKFENQNFDDIRANLSAGSKWTDPKFGHNESSLGDLDSLRWYQVEWKRVHDICKQPKLFEKGYCEDDVIQGRLGDCWFVASVASLALHHSLVKKVIPHPDKQELNREDYCGILLFRFHRFGEWIEVVVDDYLPTYYNEENELKLALGHSNKPNEFWAAFLEKAYAKLDGSYEGLAGGYPADALNDLTGGMSERIDFRDVDRSESGKNKMYRQLKTALSRDAVVSLAILKSKEEVEGTGLVDHHAYSLLSCFDIPQDVNIFAHYMRDLVRVRNPWGHKEWTGRWRDKDPIWSEIPQKIKRAMDYEDKNDGEYWMEFDDLVHNFTYMTICRMIKTGPNGGDNCWHQRQIYSKWVPGSTAGGCSNYLDTFFTNPQFQFQIEHEHDETVQIVLAQPDTRSDQDKENMSIGFKIYKVADGNTEKVKSFKDIVKISSVGKFSNLRQRYKKFELDVGTYVIIPSTYKPNVAGEFLLRILTEREAHVTELPMKD